MLVCLLVLSGVHCVLDDLEKNVFDELEEPGPPDSSGRLSQRVQLVLPQKRWAVQ